MAGRFAWLWGRPLLLAIAVMNVITGAAALWLLAPVTAGSDVEWLRRGAEGFLGHYPVPDYVFSPLSAILAVPLGAMSPAAAAVSISAFEAALLATGVALETRTRRGTDRALVFLAVFGFLPVAYELLIGQVTIVIAAGLYPVVARDGARRGVLLGVVLATVPKPFLIPALLWMAIHRRRALATAIGVAAALTVASIPVVGLESFGWWAEALRNAGEVYRHGNMSVWADGASAPSIALALAVVVVAVASLRSGEGIGMMAALLAGLLLAPYTLVYALSILLVPLRRTFDAAPRLVAGLALGANLCLFTVSTAWLAAAYVGVTAVIRPWRVRSGAPQFAGPGAGGPAGAGPSG
jgi:hypothetical protein